MDNGFSRDCVNLAEACKALAKEKLIQGFLKKEFGNKNYLNALEAMKSGKLTGDIGSTVHDLLIDAIANQSTTVWSGLIHNVSDKWPVDVLEYHGVFWVKALESDPIGYFLDLDSAVSFARSNWDNVYETEKDPDLDDGEIHCPFCDTTDTCEHLLLVIDQTFRQAEGGVLYEALNAKWSKIVEEADDPNFDEHEPFDDLLQEVDSLSDAKLTASPDSAPGMSSTYSYFYCSSKKKTMTALKKFSIN